MKFSLVAKILAPPGPIAKGAAFGAIGEVFDPGGGVTEPALLRAARYFALT
jgi:hypothetical protein